MVCFHVTVESVYYCVADLMSKKMVATSKGRNHKKKGLSCSTPEHPSPSRDSDSSIICDSDDTSPVPFFCTQDGVDGETDVVWNYYTPKSENAQSTRLKNSTPLSSKPKKIVKQVAIEKPLPKRRTLRSSQKKTELFQDLIDLNKNLHKFMENKPVKSITPTRNGSDEDIFSNSTSSSPKSGLKTNNRCLRKNLLISKFAKPENDIAMESDDSMNECLLQAVEIVEEKIMKYDLTQQTQTELHEPADNILDNIKIVSPVIGKVKKIDSPCFNNDSFDNFVANLNDSALDRLTQAPIKNATPVRCKINKAESTTDWVLEDIKLHESGSITKNVFGRHSSMPESPTVSESNKPSMSGTIFGRYNSMPINKNHQPKGDLPKCTPEEIRRKHNQAREKLMAKRLLPFTNTQQSTQASQRQASSTQVTQQPVNHQPAYQQQSHSNSQVSAPKRPCFQPRFPTNSNKNTSENITLSANLKELIEKKRQEAIMKLRRKQMR